MNSFNIDKEDSSVDSLFYEDGTSAELVDEEIPMRPEPHQTFESYSTFNDHTAYRNMINQALHAMIKPKKPFSEALMQKVRLARTKNAAHMAASHNLNIEKKDAPKEELRFVLKPTPKATTSISSTDNNTDCESKNTGSNNVRNDTSIP